MSGEPPSISSKLSPPGVAGVAAFERLVNIGLSVTDQTGVYRPRLAETLPSVDNGLWQVFPDGTMETTWRIIDGARWHDGTPLTGDDLLFTAQAVRDPELPALGDAAYASLGAVQKLDERTVRAQWSRPYVNADRLFGGFALPLPKHLLESAYLDSKGSFTDQPYWTSAFVGNGPFKIDQWVPGSHVVLRAFDGYALGRPKIDEVEVRFILDANVIVSTVLADEIDVTLGRNFGPQHGVLVRQQWRGGRVDVGRASSAMNIWPQFIDPNPVIVTDLRFRQALYEALDRQTMADVLEGGLSRVADSWLVPGLPEYSEIEHYVVRYPYDPARASREIEALGYSRGPDAILRDAGGQRLEVELRTLTIPEINQHALISTADYWQKIGVGVTQVIIPTQRAGDLPYRATFPAFQLLRYPSDAFADLSSLASRAAGLPENGFRGTNFARYQNADFDALIDLANRTISRRERLEITGQIVQHMTERLTAMTLFYDPSLGFVSNRMVNVPPLGDDPPWNAEQWDVS